MRVSKDIFIHMIRCHFDLETQYQCQYVCQWAYSAILDKEKIRVNHVNLRAQKKQREHYLSERKLEIKLRLTSVPKWDKKVAAKRLNEMLTCCPKCHLFIGYEQHECIGTCDRFCQWCGAEYYNLRGGSEHYKYCSFPLTCEIYTIAMTGCDVDEAYATECNFVGNRFKVKWHYENKCVRRCQCCDEPITAAKIATHVKKCFGSDRLPVGVEQWKYWNARDQVKYGRIL